MRNLTMMTDFYQLTMMYGYMRKNMQDKRAVFDLFYRKTSANSVYAVAAGLEQLIEYINNLHFDEEDIAYLRSLGCFDEDFLRVLAGLRFEGDLYALPEGTLVFPGEPIVRVEAPIMQAQLIETALLNIVNHQTLIATKASRVAQAAQSDLVMEFGLRRAQGPDAGIYGARAAIIGGCKATSNVLTGQMFGVPVKGTHAHSWVMAFDSEIEAFETYARALPSNATLLVDTYNTLDGVRHAVEVGKRLRAQGHDLLGVRLDSGDLAYLSVEARKILDEAGFHQTSIVASSDLDEHIIASLKTQGAAINAWGVGTRLATGYDQPAMGGVYKLSAIRKAGGPWEDRVKLSEQLIKTSNPGILQVRRYLRGGEAVGDAIYDLQHPIADGCTMVDPADITRRKAFASGMPYEDLLVPVFRGGRRVGRLPAIEDIRRRVRDQLALFHGGVKRFINPHRYPVGLETGLHQRKTELILKQRGFAK